MPAPDLGKGKKKQSSEVGTLPFRYGARSREDLARRMGQPEVAESIRVQQLEAARKAKEDGASVMVRLSEQARAVLEAAQLQFQQLAQHSNDATLMLLLGVAQKARPAGGQGQNMGGQGGRRMGGKLAAGSQFAGKVDLSTFQRPLPNWYTPILVRWNGIVLQRDTMVALQKASRDIGAVIFGGGWRSHADQVRLKAQKPTLAATPGTSYHEVGLAIDVDIGRLQGMGKWEAAKRALARRGFKQFNSSLEPWHFSYLVTG